MSEPYLGEIRLVPYDFTPEGFLTCDGRLLSIAQYTALYSLLGTTYGGDGNTTFGLPDLRGRVPVHKGQGTGLSFRQQGDTGGTETVTLLAAQMGPHAHAVRASTTAATAAGPTGAALAAVPAGQGGDTFYATSPGSATATAFAAAAIQASGGSRPHGNTAPTLTLRYVIQADQNNSIFPSPN